MKILESTIAALSPRWAASRARYRREIKAYEAATSTRLRRKGSQTRGPSSATKTALKPLREIARQLEEDHDIVVGILNTFVNNVIGTGIAIEPQPKRLDGSLHEEFAAELLEMQRMRAVAMDSSGELDRGQAERLACRTWCRDGEVFGQMLAGSVGGIVFPTPLPYAVEMMEPDLVPHDREDSKAGIYQGIQRDRWGRPIAYLVYPAHPGDFAAGQPVSIPAERMLHLKHTIRLRQNRGVSMLASIIDRIQDIKSYEEYERVAAKVAASMTAYIRKGVPENYASAEKDSDGNRLLEILPGMVWDELYEGEEVGTIQSTRPSNLLLPFREAMLRAAAAGSGTGYSSISKSYTGTYSAQRQELVEQFIHYSAATANFVNMWSRPDYRQAVSVWMTARNRILSSENLADISDLDERAMFDAEFRGPVMPWIDPSKEADACIKQVQAGFKSRSQVIRERGGNPESTFAEIVNERGKDYDDGMVFLSDYAALAQRGSADTDPRDNSQFSTSEEDAA